MFESGISYEEALGAVKEKFTQSRKFFGSSLMSVRFQGIDLTVDQEMELCDAITGSCDIKIACVLEDDEEKDSTFASAIRIVDDILDDLAARGAGIVAVEIHVLPFAGGGMVVDDEAVGRDR